VSSSSLPLPLISLVSGVDADDADGGDGRRLSLCRSPLIPKNAGTSSISWKKGLVGGSGKLGCMQPQHNGTREGAGARAGIPVRQRAGSVGNGPFASEFPEATGGIVEHGSEVAFVVRASPRTSVVNRFTVERCWPPDAVQIGGEALQYLKPTSRASVWVRGAAGHVDNGVHRGHGGHLECVCHGCGAGEVSFACGIRPQRRALPHGDERRCLGREFLKEGRNL